MSWNTDFGFEDLISPGGGGSDLTFQSAPSSRSQPRYGISTNNRQGVPQSSSGRMSISELSLGIADMPLCGVIIAKEDARSFPNKKDPGTERHLLSFTIRDSETDSVNVTCWGSLIYVQDLASQYHIGDVVELTQFVIQSKPTDGTDEKFRPSTSGPFQMSVSENRSTLSVYQGPDTAELSGLSHALGKAANDYYTISDILTNGKQLHGQTINIMAVVRSMLRTPAEDQFCLAPFEGEYYRARIVSVNKDKQRGQHVRVFFMDYGNVSDVQSEMLRELQPHLLKLSFQAFECELAEVRPSQIKCPAGTWTEEAKMELIKIITNSTKSYGKVYSVVHGVVRLELHVEAPGHNFNVNQYLIDMGFADHAEEGFVSKQDHADREDERVSSVLANQRATGDWLAVAADDYVDIKNQTRSKKNRSTSQRLTLQGPTSPYEMVFYGQTTVSRLRTVHIDQDSINAIVLDDKPEDMHQRLLVAANVSLNPSGNRIKLRETSLMPHIPGLPSLLTILFTPYAELRTDARHRRYIGALCGLGWDSFNEGPVLPDHDIELPFDVYIDKHDIVKINAVRIAINVAIGCGEDLLSWGPNAVIKTQHKARDNLLKLLQRRRESMKPVYAKFANQWNQVKPEDLLPASVDTSGEVNRKHLYNLHPLVALVEEDTKSDVMPFEKADRNRERVRARMLQHIDYLQNKANEKSFSEQVECMLCKFKLPTPHHLKLHLATRMHKEEETRYLI